MKMKIEHLAELGFDTEQGLNSEYVIWENNEIILTIYKPFESCDWTANYEDPINWKQFTSKEELEKIIKEARKYHES